MSLSSSNLLQWIAYSHYLVKEYGKKLEVKLRYGTSCEDEKKNLKLATWLLNEVELYYLDCSCLVENDICNFIVRIQKLLK